MTAPTRADTIARLRDQQWDLVVIGGGITGVGVALDAASRGLRTALVERDDLASGTSSKSSKLVHGGLRYLSNGEIRLVYEALRERHRLLRNAPHLVEVLPFMIPIMTRDGVISARIAKALGSALWMYDLTGGWRIGRRHRRIDAAAAQEHFPTADPDRLSGGFIYFDAAADDARLTLTVARTAMAHGAAVLNHCEVIGLDPDATGQTHVLKVRARTLRGDSQEFVLHTRSVVNATGVWADEISRIEDPTVPPRVRPAKGIHITVPWDKIRNDIAVVIPVPHDKRSLFIVPWGPRPNGGFEYAFVGTTDTEYDGPVNDPQCESADLDYVLHALNASVTDHIAPTDVIGVWSGLRPLVRSETGAEDRTADLSRHHAVDTSPRGVVTVTGGKLTTYRLMAADAVDAALAAMGTPKWRIRLLHRSRTRRLSLVGAGPRLRARSMGRPQEQFPGASQVSDATRAHLWGRYGTESAQIYELITERPELGAPLHPGAAYLRAEVVFAVRHEMALSVADVCQRRFRTHIFDRDLSRRIALAVAEVMAPELGWTPAERDRSLAAYLEICAAEDRAAHR